jgi:hypothetical protein
MSMSMSHGGVVIVIQRDTSIMKVYNRVPCEFRLINKRDVSYKLCVYKSFLLETIDKTPPLHDGQEE